MIARSSRAPSGGSTALRTRWTRRSELVTVPSDSAQAAVAGRTTSASCGGLRQEQVLDDQEVEPREQVDGARLVRLRLDRVLADAVDGGQLAALHRVEHPRQVPAALRRDRDAPLGVEPGSELIVLDVLEARQPVGEGAHVTAALDVVLATQRVDAAAVATDVAGQQDERDQGEDVVDRVVVLGDAERPADHRPRRCGEGVGQLADGIGRDARLALGVVERVRLDLGLVGLEAGRRAVDERAVLEAGGDDLARDGVGQRDVASRRRGRASCPPIRRCWCDAGRPRTGARRPGRP